MIRTLVECAILLLCICLSAFFSGIETGIISINRLRLVHRSRAGSKNAQIIDSYRRTPDRLLGTTLVGNNFVNVLIPILSTELAIRFWGDTALVAGAVAVATTVLLLVFGEYLPKAWFSCRPMERCLPFARVLRAIEILLSPFAKVLMAITAWVSVRGRKAKNAKSPFVTRENLQWLANDSERGGQISTLELIMINRVLTLQGKTAREIMRPLSVVKALRPDETVADAAKAFSELHYEKMPVISRDEHGQTCHGILFMRDVLPELESIGQDSVVRHMRRSFFIRDDVRADDVLPMMRRAGQRLAIVRNRSGELLGIVTAPGILRMIVGNLPAAATGDRKGEKPSATIIPPSILDTPATQG